jgi:transcriptional regulator with XRE-family HTH domain
MTKTLVEEYVEDPTHMRLFQQERAIYEVTELLELLMTELGVNRAELAKRLGKSRGWVTQLLDGEANKTIRTVADAFAVLGHEYRSFYRPIKIGSQSGQTASSSVMSSNGDARQHFSPRERFIIKMYHPAITPVLQEEEIQIAAQ